MYSTCTLEKGTVKVCKDNTYLHMTPRLFILSSSPSFLCQLCRPRISLSILLSLVEDRFDPASLETLYNMADNSADSYTRHSTYTITLVQPNKTTYVTSDLIREQDFHGGGLVVVVAFIEFWVFWVKRF